MTELVDLFGTSCCFEELLGDLTFLVDYAWKDAQHVVAGLHEEEVD